MKSPTQSGATLVETLVVIAIIAVLLALLAPTMRHTWIVANQARCAANLHRIGEAFGIRTADEVTAQAGPLAVSHWSTALLPYLEDRTDLLVCPEGGLHGRSDKHLLPIRVHFVGSGADTFCELDGPFVIKFSDSQYCGFRAQGYFAGSSMKPPPDAFKPDGQPDVAWYCIEESCSGFGWDSGGEDYEDIRMRVARTLGSVALDFEVGSLSIDTHIETFDGECLVEIPRGIYREPFPGGSFPILGDEPADTSYGMNVRAADIARMPAKVLALDYADLLAASDDQWADPACDPDGDGVPTFARHQGLMNVLFADGSVRTMAPGEIDPLSPDAAFTYWDP